jgi:hypothetical protein
VPRSVIDRRVAGPTCWSSRHQVVRAVVAQPVTRTQHRSARRRQPAGGLQLGGGILAEHRTRRRRGGRPASCLAPPTADCSPPPPEYERLVGGRAIAYGLADSGWVIGYRTQPSAASILDVADRAGGCWPTAACAMSRPSSSGSPSRCSALSRARCAIESPDRITRSEWLMLGDRLRPGDTDP